MSIDLPISDPIREAMADRAAGEQLQLDLDGFEGPIDLLLALARDQKVDLAKISILALVEQYLAFVAQAKRLRLELAADYIVMAAWLAYLKSRLLLPDPPADDDEPSGEELAERLAFQLRRLEAMREAGAALMRLPQKGREVFGRGTPETIGRETAVIYDVSLYDLLSAYAGARRRTAAARLTIEADDLFAIESAVRRLEAMLGIAMGSWTALSRFLPPGYERGVRRRSALASTLVAGLELAKRGDIQLRQDRPFGPIYIRARGRGDAPD
ncbi:MAG: ScpA family protein [Pseudomonadota bacterium]